MAAKKASKQSTSKKGGTKGSAKKGSAVKTQVQKTAAKVLAGAAAGAVRAIIGPLEEAASTGEEVAGLNKPGGGGRSTGKSGGKSSK